MAPVELLVSATFYGQVVEERFMRSGKPVRVGGTELLSVPSPEGADFVAVAKWVARDRVDIEAWDGQRWILTQGGPIRLELGPVDLTFELVRRRFRIPFALPTWTASFAWLFICTMVTLGVRQMEFLHDYRCEVGPRLVDERTVWRLWPECSPPMSEDNSTLTAFTAEYLARLLTKDYAGDDQGVVSREVERPESERKIVQDNQTYLPAGAAGPKDTMGGAERVTVVPKRDPEPAKAPKLEPKAEEEQLLQKEGDVPIDAAPPAPAQPTESGDDTQEVRDGPSEDVEGWGIPDWYDEEDERFDSLEIDVMLRLAERRLAIDPNDSYSLSVLSYYQYLAMDYPAAEQTYDKYIALNPSEAAGYNNKGLIYKRRGEYIMEEAHYRVALDLDENDVTALNNLAVCLAHQGRFDEALGVMARLELLDPGDAYADLHRSKIYAEMGNEAKAMEYLDAALKGMQQLDTLHHIEFRQDIRIDPSFAALRKTKAFRELLWSYYGEDAPVLE